MPRNLRVSSLIVPWLVSLCLSGCASEPQPMGGHEVPLIDGHHAPDVLTEGAELRKPPAIEGGRFVKGWRFFRRDGELRLVPWEAPRLEVVTLEPRPRELVLPVEVSEAPEGAAITVRAGGEERELALTSPLEVPLPADLPLGRGPVDLELAEGVRFSVDRVGVRPAHPAGEVDFQDGGFAQSGWSLVDVTRRLPAGTALRGRFVPPPGASPEQRFALLVERRAGAPETVFEWRGTTWARLGGARELDVLLGDDDGLVRLRFLAQGTGAPARWEALDLVLPEPPPAPPAIEPPPRPRLVVLYVLDALRADHLGHLGGDPTLSPHLDRLAKRSAVFTRHLSVAPNTLPSTKSLFTGQAYRVRGGGKLLADGPETLAEALAGAGYRTASFSANGHISPDFGLLRGFEHDGRPAIFAGGMGAVNDSAERVEGAALEWLDRLPESESAFLYVHSLNPHNPYEPPEPFRRRFAADGGSEIDGSTKTLLGIKRRRVQVDEADEDRLRALYAAGVAYNDARIGLLVEELERRYAPGEVLLIVTSDHGEELFDHGGVLHGYTLYDEQLHVPLLFHWPSRVEPRRVEAPTDNLDLHETLRSLAGAPPSGRGGGRSLWPLILQGSAEGRREVRFAAASSLDGGLFMARTPRHKLVWAPRTGAGWGMGEGLGRSRDPEYFFDLERDPGETRNLAGTPSLEAAWLRGRLLAWVERGRVLESGAREEALELDEETRANLKALGYLD